MTTNRAFKVGPLGPIFAAAAIGSGCYVPQQQMTVTDIVQNPDGFDVSVEYSGRNASHMEDIIEGRTVSVFLRNCTDRQEVLKAYTYDIEWDFRPPGPVGLSAPFPCSQGYSTVSEYPPISDQPISWPEACLVLKVESMFARHVHGVTSPGELSEVAQICEAQQQAAIVTEP